MTAIGIVTCCGLLATVFEGMSYDHVDTYKLDGTTYRLGFNHGMEPEWDYFLYEYVVWECDFLVCTRLYNPYHDSNRVGEMPRLNAHFTYDEAENILYVQIDDELYPVPIHDPH